MIAAATVHNSPWCVRGETARKLPRRRELRAYWNVFRLDLLAKRGRPAGCPAHLATKR